MSNLKFKIPRVADYEDENEGVRAYHDAYRLVEAYRKAERESRGASYPKVVELINELEILRGYPKRNMAEIERCAGKVQREAKKIRREGDRKRLLHTLEERGMIIEPT